MITLDMIESSSDYKRAYETAKRELAELITTQERLENKKIELRKTIEILNSVCESEHVDIEPSQEAAYLLENSTIADEVRAILRSQYPAWMRPHQLKAEVEHLGHDLSNYGNPQATIHMVLKRMVQSGDVFEMISPNDGKQVYRCPSTLKDMAIETTSKPRPKVTLKYVGAKKK
jgi:hypothetical protein